MHNPRLPVRPTLQEMVDALPGDGETVLGMPCDKGWREVRRYPTDLGHDVVVYVHRLPADFYRIESPELSSALTTGSGCAELAERIAQALADGLLGSEVGV